MRKFKVGRKNRIGLSLTIIITSAVVTLVSSWLVVGLQSDSIQPQSIQPQKVQPAIVNKPVKVTTYSMPVRLVIPKIKVDTTIVNMGLTTSGNLEAPNTNEAAGWYKDGPRPGNEGSAVIDGHFGVGGRAVFTDLNKLQKGDTLSVIDDKGQTASFVVRETRAYDQNSQPNEVFNSTMGAHLNLITCDGAWQAGQRTYSQRLVVFTDRQP